jgi:hypothetical protein
MSTTTRNLLPFRVILLWGIEKGLDRTGKMKRDGVEGQELNALLRTLKPTMLCELVFSHDGGAKFVWSTLLVVFFVLRPSRTLSSR